MTCGSSKVGFEDISHFYRTFKEVTKTSPSKYRKKYRIRRLN
ncbi:helix-turn-helix domain-containing protein [uncultured Metabacillus sp.]